MAELLLEIFSEEIPARMQLRAASDLERLVKDGLTKAALAEGVTFRSYVTPRRLVLVADGLPKAQADTSEEKRGPRIGAPEQALDGFLKSTGLSKDELEVRKSGKDEYYFATIAQKGRPTADVLASVIAEALATLPWPKSMRWGDYDTRWVRPLHNILCLFSGKVVPVGFAHLTANDQTFGHRFLSPEAVQVKNFEEYNEQLREKFVLIDHAERQQLIRTQANDVAASQGLRVKEDAGLLEEVAGLVEWPTVYIGSFDESFMDVPSEALTSEMRSHQKYFSLETESGEFAPNFLMISNMTPKDGGAQVIVGNERVLKARLSDARFFWDQDRKIKLEDRLPILSQVTFHAKLGTIADKVERVRILAKTLVENGWVKAPAKQVDRAAQLCKADLVSGMVGEFPELQGIMGCYYAKAQKEESSVATAIREHYSPQGPNDSCPTASVSVAIALADKLDTLAGMFAVGEKPTGSKDPFALRRAALGIIRIVLENNLRIPLRALLSASLGKKNKEETVTELLTFFADRLKVMLKDQGHRHDLIEAIFDEGKDDDLVRITARVKALGAFLATENGTNLLAAYKRAANILRIEEKKDNTSYSGDASAKLLDQPEEKSLFDALAKCRPDVEKSLKAEQYDNAMTALASLRAPVDAFFDKVTVNCDDAATRKNRLTLLSQIRTALDNVANFGKIEG